MSSYIKNYTQVQKEILKNTKLNPEQIKEFNTCIAQLSPGHPVINVFKDIYRFYICDMPVSDIAKMYNKSTRTIQMILKDVGLARDRYKAQRIASKKRDYVAIRKTYKKLCWRDIKKMNYKEVK